GTGGSTSYHWSASNGASGDIAGTSVTLTGLAAGSYTVTVSAVNDGGKRSGDGTSGAAGVQAQTLPPAPASVAANVTRSEQAGAIAWSGPAVTGGPEVTSGMRYEVSLDGTGSPVNVASSTSYARSDLAAGSHTLFVRAVNK